MRKWITLVFTAAVLASNAYAAGVPKISDVRVAYSAKGQEVQICGRNFGSTRQDGRVLFMVGKRVTPTGHVRVWTNNMIVVMVPNEIRINNARIQVAQGGQTASRRLTTQSVQLIPDVRFVKTIEPRG